jgi:hypothetical protein
MPAAPFVPLPALQPHQARTPSSANDLVIFMSGPVANSAPERNGPQEWAIALHPMTQMSR